MTNQYGKDMVKTKKCNCLNCGTVLNALGTANPKVEAKPEPGNVAVCIKCGAVMMLGDQLQLRGMTDEEMNKLILDSEFMDEIALMVGKVKFMQGRYE